MTQRARTRDVLDQFPAYRPGRSPEDVARELGIDRVVKLASNENPYGPLPGVIEQAVAGATVMNRYPDNGTGLLRETLAARLDVDPASIVTGCGSVGLCQQLVQAVCDAGDAALYGWRSFESYPLFVSVAGARSILVPLRDERYDLDALLDALPAALDDRLRLVFLCNPNNPTGTAVGRAAIERFLDAVPPSVLVVYDEAYREFVRDPEVPDGLDLHRAHPNVAVLRTFSKAYGLAGLRVGYCVAAPEVVEALGKTQVPFAVSTVAQLAAVASLAPEVEQVLAERVADIVTERCRVTEKLRGMGLAVPDSQANFVWLSLGAAAVPFAAACERRGAIVRPFATDGVRVTIGTPEENDVFLGVVEDALAEATG
ncbi:MAG: histidinol-phosphate transaminase [Frankiaceae bacterium]